MSFHLDRPENVFMNITEALDELVGGPPAPNPNNIVSTPPGTIETPIPSAPPQIGDAIPTVFNPTALTVDIPTASTP